MKPTDQIHRFLVWDFGFKGFGEDILETVQLSGVPVVAPNLVILDIRDEARVCLSPLVLGFLFWCLQWTRGCGV